MRNPDDYENKKNIGFKIAKQHRFNYEKENKIERDKSPGPAIVDLRNTLGAFHKGSQATSVSLLKTNGRANTSFYKEFEKELRCKASPGPGTYILNSTLSPQKFSFPKVSFIYNIIRPKGNFRK